MSKLGVNVDHIANIRQSRKAIEPDPVTAALIAEMAGAESITVHLRSDRRHIQDEDVRLLRRMVKTKLNLEMAATEEMVKIACEIKPDTVTLVPEKPQEVTTEGGLNILAAQDELERVCAALKSAGVSPGIFIDPDSRQVRAAQACRADFIEFHTGIYAAAKQSSRQAEELNKIVQAGQATGEMGLVVNAGHDLNYRNVQPIAAIPFMNELNIGHSIIARAAFVGIERAVRQMADLIKEAGSKQ
ncbi:MAG: pyridoxine 5'-phosphate synthase [Candidatus Schekmanbacteria bacterium]|nr:pyridoxine 5'-phosphate synthase [Candidatus Schekmanbacteria bacterium]